MSIKLLEEINITTNEQKMLLTKDQNDLLSKLEEELMEYRINSSSQGSILSDKDANILGELSLSLRNSIYGSRILRMDKYNYYSWLKDLINNYKIYLNKPFSEWFDDVRPDLTKSPGYTDIYNGVLMNTTVYNNPWIKAMLVNYKFTIITRTLTKYC